MLPFLTERFGNPSRRRTRVAATPARALDEARDVVADGARLPSPARSCSPAAAPRPTTSPSSASCGATAASPCARRAEHHAVLARGRARRRAGRRRRRGRRGRPRRAGRRARRPTSRVVSVMLANNEVGTIQPLADGRRRRARAGAGRGAPHRRRAGASRGSTSRRRPPAADLVAVVAHKFGGPKGVGALVVRGRRARSSRCCIGGGQERDRRSGTHNVAGIVGHGRGACGVTVAERDGDRGARAGAARPAASTACWRAVPGLRPRPCRATRQGRRHLPTSASRASRARRCCSCSTTPASCASAASSCAQRRHGAVPRAGGHGRAAGAGRRLAAAVARLVATTDADVDLAPRRRPGRRRAACGATGRRMRVKVLVAMTGGVDSSVAAALLLDAGPRGRRRHDEAVGRRERHRLLLGGRRRRRPPRRPAARHRPPRVQLRRRVRPRTWSSPTSTPTPPGARPTRASSATGTSSSTGCCRRADAARLRRRRHRPPRPRRSRGRRRAGVCAGAPTGPRTRATCCTCSTSATLARTLFPVGDADQGRGARRAAALGLRTAAQARQPGRVLHHVAARPARAFLGARLAAAPRHVVDTGGRHVGEVDAVELVTVGQRKGLGGRAAGRPATSSTSTSPPRRVTVGSAG